LFSHEGGEYPEPDPPLHGISSNAPWRGYKTEVYEGGIRVPALLSWVGQLPPRKIQAPLHAIDWLPTICQLVGATQGLPANTDGRDIWSILTGQQATPAPRTLYWVTKEERKWIALRHGDWKIIRFRKQPWHLYNLKRDPTESQDLATELPAKLQQLLALYQLEKGKDRIDPTSDPS
jgi:arylsulfatase A-like enzyme